MSSHLRCPTDMQRCKRKGFSLVELLVVIAIVALLSALLLPVLSGARARAQNVQCIGNLRQLGMGLQNFLANNHGYISVFARGGDDYPGTWLWQLETAGLGIAKPATNSFQVGVWRCPSAHFGDWTTRMTPGAKPTYYAYNIFGLGDRTNSLGLGGHHEPDTATYVRTTEAEVISPSDMMAIGDAFDGGVFLIRFNLRDAERWGNSFTRHQGRGNTVFCDGHVGSPTLQILFVDTSDEALSRWNRDRQPHRELLPP